MRTEFQATLDKLDKVRAALSAWENLEPENDDEWDFKERMIATLKIDRQLLWQRLRNIQITQPQFN